jgi:flagellar basal body-associated protein FliL
MAGTAYGVITGSRARRLAREAVPTTAAAAGVFDSLGRIRSKTADDTPVVVVVDLAFPYDATDRQFREELTRRRGDLRSAAAAYFAGKRAAELSPADEAAVKAGLRDTLNGLLSLGRIEELYFSEFRVIE